MKHYFPFVFTALLSIGCGAPSEGDFDAPGEEPSLGEAQEPVAASVCGAGYKLIDVLPLGVLSGGYPKGGGELEVFYNASKGMNCLVEQALGAQYGKNKRMFVSVCTAAADANGTCNRDGDFDGGDFKYYAGPVYIKAPHQCIYYAAGIYPGPTATTSGLPAYYLQGTGYCN